MTRGQIFLMGIVPGPAAWFLNLNANFALAPVACTWGWKFALHAVSAAALLAVAVAAGVCWKNSGPVEGDTLADSRYRFALAGLALNALFFLVILAQALPNFLLAGCE
jgi:hypothetical protein